MRHSSNELHGWSSVGCVCHVDEGVLFLLKTKSDHVELLGPLWSLVGVGEHAEDEDEHWDNAANVGTQGTETRCLSIIRISSLSNESVCNSFNGKERTEDLDPRPALADHHRVYHLKDELWPVLQEEGNACC